MSLRNTSSTYGGLAKLMHWLMFFGFVAMFGLGFYMTGLPLGPDMFQKIGWHKSLGMIMLGLAILRLIWRFSNSTPVLPHHMPLYERLGAHFSHIALYGVMFALPLSGWAMSSAANFPISVFGCFTLPMLMDPNKEAVELLKQIHLVLVWFTIGLVALHVAAALKHHFVDKDDVLTRMSPLSNGE